MNENSPLLPGQFLSIKRVDRKMKGSNINTGDKVDIYFGYSPLLLETILGSENHGKKCMTLGIPKNMLEHTQYIT